MLGQLLILSASIGQLTSFSATADTWIAPNTGQRGNAPTLEINIVEPKESLIAFGPVWNGLPYNSGILEARLIMWPIDRGISATCFEVIDQWSEASTWTSLGGSPLISPLSAGAGTSFGGVYPIHNLFSFSGRHLHVCGDGLMFCDTELHNEEGWGDPLPGKLAIVTAGGLNPAYGIACCYCARQIAQKIAEAGYITNALCGIPDHYVFQVIRIIEQYPEEMYDDVLAHTRCPKHDNEA